jgi:hypothetical protein
MNTIQLYVVRNIKSRFLQQIQMLAVVTIAIFSAGCQITPTFTTGYYVYQETLRPQPIQSSLAVKRFEEARPDRLYTKQGRMFLTYIPLLPYVSLPFERLDESVNIQSNSIKTSGSGITAGASQNVAPDFEEYTYPASVPRAIAADLDATGLFDKVVYVGTEATDSYRYVLSGQVRESPLHETVSSYGLGMGGVLLWFLPIPMEKTSAGIVVDLTLTDTATDTVIWNDTIESEVSRLITLYNSSAMVYGRSGAFSFNLIPPPSDSQVDQKSLFSWHFEALRRAMQDAKPKLAAALQEQL